MTGRDERRIQTNEDEARMSRQLTLDTGDGAHSKHDQPPRPGAPDWSAINEEIQCPLCEYNLRGLAEARCPECGFAFAWPEVIDPARRIHRFLFEHHPERNVWSFCRTFVAGMRPVRFWRSLHPAQFVSLRRLLAYWAVWTLLCLVAVGAFMAVETANTVRSNGIKRAWFERYGKIVDYSSFDRAYPIAPLAVAINVVTEASFILACSVLLIVWPWLSMLGLLAPFQTRARAKIRTGQIVRCAVYSFDTTMFAGMLVAFACAIAIFLQPGGRGLADWFWPGCCVLIIYPWCVLFPVRLCVAYRSYLRFPDAVSVVIISQVISVLVCAVLLLQLFQK